MKRALLVCSGGVALIAISLFFLSNSLTQAATTESIYKGSLQADRGFEVQILVDGRSLEEYRARGRSYVEALPGAEYEVRVYNPMPYRIAVALSVDGLNSIDARHTTAWNASKWVIEPFSTINVSGWQMSSERARRFYFTSERNSYGAKLGETSNLGVVSAVFYRERRPYPIPISPPYPLDKEDERGRSGEPPSAGSSSESSVGGSDSAMRNQESGASRKGQVAPPPDDEYAATGIGRSVRNDVRWVNLELDSRPSAEVVIRYEYYPALVRLGIMPRPYPRPDPLGRREAARGFDDRRFSPEP